MPYPSITFADFLDPATRQEMEQYASLVQGYLSNEHDETGAHTHVTALSLDVEDTASVGDDLDVGNASVVLSETAGDAQGSAGGTGPGLRLNADPASATPGSWDVFVDTQKVDNLTRGGLVFRHAQRDRSLAYFRYDSDAGSEVYAFVPHDDIKETGSGQMNLGSDSDGSDQGWWDKAYITNLYLGNNATTAAGQWTTYTPSWTNVTVGNGTVTARYAQVGKTVRGYVRFVLGNTSAITGSVIVSLPVTLHASMPATVRIGNATYRDDSAGQQYWGGATVATSTTIALFDNASPFANVAAAVPFAWTTSDSLFVFFQGEVA